MKYLSWLFLFVSFSCFAAIDIVFVPAALLYTPDAGTNLGFPGKVEYSLTAGPYNSIYETFRILPAGGGAPLELTEVSGDVETIRIAQQNVSEKHSIFFQTPKPAAGQYIARITANAETSAEIKRRIS